MIVCSSCHQSLPDWAQKCQFCGADVSKVARPVGVDTRQTTSYSGTASWIWPAYYVLCLYWILSALGNAFNAYHTAVTPVTIKLFGQSMTEAPGFSFWTYIDFAIAAFGLLVGIGLAARVELARGIANFFACLKILRGVLGIATALMSSLFIGFWGLLISLLSLLDVVAGAMTIYLIGETEKSAPNF